MINEIIFFSHIFLIIATLTFAFTRGAELLMTTTALFTLLSNLFILKSITLFSFTATACDPFTIGIVLGLNLLQEHYGFAHAQKAIMINTITTIIFLMFAQLHCAYLPALTDTMAPLYEQLFFFVPRITLVSLLSYYLSQTVDAYSYAFFRRLTDGSCSPATAKTITSFCSMATSQLFDTLFFTYAALSGIHESLWSIALVSYTIKLIAIVISSPTVALSYKLKAKK